MATRLEILVDRLDGQLGKRRKELTDIRLLSSGASGSTGATIRRAGHVLTYAHWEGFSKYAFQQYLEYLCQTGFAVESLKLQLRALNYWTAFKSVANSLEFDAMVRLMQELGQAASTPFAVDARELTKTGNLDSKKFHALLTLCALEYRPIYQTRENFIDQVLCGRRHRIAHGLLEPISSADLVEAIDGTVELCDEINEQIQDALLYHRYADT
jgi:MAE_28990/MAE_18760-like HEPN